MLIRRTGTLALALVLSACTSVAGPDEVLDVSIATSADVLHIGEWIDLKVTVTNHGARDVEFHASGCAGISGIYVVSDLVGEVVGPGYRFCSLVLTGPLRLPPGEQIELSAQWVGDSHRSPISGPRIYVEPGEYQVQGQITVGSRRVLSPPKVVRVAD